MTIEQQLRIKIMLLETDKKRILKEKEYAFKLLKKHGIHVEGLEMSIIRTLEHDECVVYYNLHKNNKSEHALAREHKIATGNIVYGFEVNRPPRPFNDYHFITDKAEMICFNAETNKYSTTMFLRPGNLKKYDITDAKIVDAALHNLKTGKNAI